MEIKMSMISGGKKGKAGSINVQLGEKVSFGDILVEVETGKGNREITATVEGTISDILFEEGGEISSNQVLFTLETAEEETVALSESQAAAIEQPVMAKKVELLIIGAGPGGYVSARLH